MALDLNGLGGEPPRRRASLHVIPMALALVLAAVLGAAVGLVWQSSGLGDAASDDPAADDPAANAATLDGAAGAPAAAGRAEPGAG